MYLPEHFRESQDVILRAFVAQHPLATLVANTAEGLTANHVPLLWYDAPEGASMLRGHIARANSLWRLLEKHASVLAVFAGAQHYVSPTWYPSKVSDSKVVPTWNYSTVQVRGSIQFIDDRAWLRTLVESLTDVHEKPVAERWHVSDAPASYIDAMLRAIVGFEIRMTAIEGKFKGSQNRSPADRQGVVEGLRADNVPTAQIAELVPGIKP